ncbi:hypothetical protein [Streptomyces sp. NBC_00649]|uniref:hypothetical protein n=1 Tax=Streptomyces sp. NBC_00649 TaxID=2975798 RepID=UPI0032484303
MPWFVVDDNADSHPKMIAAGNAALGLWLKAGAYASRQLTDGIVPGGVAKMYGSKPQVAKLVAAGLWHEHGHTCPHPKCAQPAPGDYAIHDYLEYNPTRAKVQDRKSREAEKKRRQRGHQPRLDDVPPPDRAPDDGGDRPYGRDAASLIAADWQPSHDDVQAAQLARDEAGRAPLTAQQLDAVTRKFVRRQLDDQTRAASWGGRWQRWAESERPEPAQGGVVVPFNGAQQSRGQQQRAGLARLLGTGEV